MMKLASVIFTLLFAVSSRGLGQSFVNLDFEAASIFTNGAPQAKTLASVAIPGWTAYIGGSAQSYINYNATPLSAAAVTLQGTNTDFDPAIAGGYSIMLWGEFNPLANARFTNSAAIGQTGQIPPSALTLTFWGNLGGMQASFNGQPLNFIVTGSTANYTIYAADISAFAGQTGELLLTDPFYGNNFGGPATIDNLQFSNTAVPEPGEMALLALGLIGLVWNFPRRRRQI